MSALQSIEDVSIAKIAKAMLIHEGEPFSTSIQISKYFGISHKDLLKKIRDFGRFDDLISRRKISPSIYIKRGKEYPLFLLDADAFVFTCISINGAKAESFKWIFINAFKQVSAELLTFKVKAETNKANQDWMEKRSEIIEVRHALTDVIKEFCKHAQTQRGSQYPKQRCPYYFKFTNLVYNVLNISKPKGKQTVRDIYSGAMLEVIEYLEELLINLIRSHIEHDLDYHKAYSNIKEMINFKALCISKEVH